MSDDTLDFLEQLGQGTPSTPDKCDNEGWSSTRLKCAIGKGQSAIFLQNTPYCMRHYRQMTNIKHPLYPEDFLKTWKP